MRRPFSHKQVIPALAVGALTLALASAACPTEIVGRVVSVADGDTITVLDAAKEQHKIRFAGIDAPERKQPFGTRSTQNLARYVAGKEVRLDCHKVDRYQRKVCKVWVQPTDCPRCGKTLNVGLAQITDGMAWWYRRYADEQSPENRGHYESAEQEARLRKLGLWADDNPVPPWEWRRRPKSSSAQRSPIQPVALVGAQTVTLDNFFKSLKRPDSPNNWLIAPADFVIKPETVAPVFEAPVSVLRETFRSVVLRSEGAAVIAESENGMHVVATTRLMGFKDDIRVLFIPVGQHQSTLALYSASRVGYWDLGTNRRRLEDWINQTQTALANGKK